MAASRCTLALPNPRPGLTARRHPRGSGRRAAQRWSEGCSHRPPGGPPRGARRRSSGRWRSPRRRPCSLAGSSSCGPAAHMVARGIVWRLLKQPQGLSWTIRKRRMPQPPTPAPAAPSTIPRSTLCQWRRSPGRAHPRACERRPGPRPPGSTGGRGTRASWRPIGGEGGAKGRRKDEASGSLKCLSVPAASFSCRLRLLASRECE